MSEKTNSTEIEMPDIADFFTHSRAVRREAEIARSLYFSKLVSHIARKIGYSFRNLGDLLSFTQRMNQNVRL